MRKPAVEIQRLTAGLSIWYRYDSTIKADLFSTAISIDSRTYLIDPIESGDEELPIAADVVAIIVTNANHQRASEYYSAKFSVPIRAAQGAGISFAIPLSDGERLGDDLRTFAIDGAAPGEIALFSERDHGVLVVGDALINFGSHGFTFLPAKYCSNPKLMRKSLRKLLDLDFARMVFAHGTPIMSHARDHLAALLTE